MNNSKWGEMGTVDEIRSMVVPLYNEEGDIETLVPRILSAFEE